MEDKNIFSKLTLQTQTKYENTKIQTRLQGLLPWDMLKIYPAWYISHLMEVSDFQSLDIREVTIALVW